MADDTDHKPTLAIIGLGQLGCSFGLAVKAARQFSHITGYDLSAEHAREAQLMGAVDEACDSIAVAVRSADIVMLCSPISTLEPIFIEVGSHAPEGAIITDVSSVKRPVIRMAEEHLHGQTFIPGHPIAGIEKSGPGVADPLLFKHKRMLFTPDDTSLNNKALHQVSAMWEAIGADTKLMDARVHDDVFATTSHMAQLLAYAYSPILSAVEPFPQQINDYFYRFIRIGGSDTRMWADVFRYNSKRILACLYEYNVSLDMLQSHDPATQDLSFFLASIHDWRSEARNMSDEREWQPPAEKQTLHMAADHLAVTLAYAFVHAAMRAEERIGQSLHEYLGAGFLGVSRPATLDPHIAESLISSPDLTAYISALRTSLACIKDAIQQAEDKPHKLKALLDEAKRAHLQNVARLPER